MKSAKKSVHKRQHWIVDLVNWNSVAADGKVLEAWKAAAGEATAANVAATIAGLERAITARRKTNGPRYLSTIVGYGNRYRAIQPNRLHDCFHEECTVVTEIITIAIPTKYNL
eukprot:6478576-Amphidinium_carterae.1